MARDVADSENLLTLRQRRYAVGLVLALVMFYSVRPYFLPATGLPTSPLAVLTGYFEYLVAHPIRAVGVIPFTAWMLLVFQMEGPV